MNRKHTMVIVPALILAAAALPGLAGMAHGAANAAAKAAAKSTTNGMDCIHCHSNPKVVTSKRVFMDNSPPLSDILSGNATLDYLPPSLPSSLAKKGGFYGVAAGFTNSGHYTQKELPFACTNCHTTDPHDGLNGLPTYRSSCWTCHDSHESGFQYTMHGNDGNTPGLTSSQPLQTFDQRSAGRLQATVVLPGGHETGLLYASNKKTKVTRDQRIAECSVCHSYVSRYPNQFPDGESPPQPTNEVGCPACHDSHFNSVAIPERPAASNTVTITAMNGSSVLQTSPPYNGRQVGYQNFKPYKVNATGAQDWVNGTWTRGSLYERPTREIVSGTGTIGNATGTSTSDLLTITKVSSGTLSDVQPASNTLHTYTLFVSGTATSAPVTLPQTAASGADQTVTVTATFNKAGISIASVSGNSVTLVNSSSSGAITAGINTSGLIGLVANTTVTYAKTGGGTGTIPVYIPLSGNVTFTIKDAYANVETLCASCHTKGKYLYSAYAKDPATREFTPASATMNLDVSTQFRTSAHANATSNYPGFYNFRAGNFNASFQQIYPFDMSLSTDQTAFSTGQITVGTTTRNGGNLQYNLELGGIPASSVYLTASGNTQLNNTAGTYVCNHCHHGLGAIDYLNDAQGTPSASVLWGDSTLTCITCHDTHNTPDNKPSNMNLRIPQYLSYHADFQSSGNVRGGSTRSWTEPAVLPPAVLTPPPWPPWEMTPSACSAIRDVTVA